MGKLVVITGLDGCGTSTVGRDAAEGKVEYKLRREEDKEVLPVEEAVAKAIDIVNLEKDGRCFFKRLSEETLKAH